MNIIKAIKDFRQFLSFKSMYAEQWQKGQTYWSVQNDKEYIKQGFNQIVWVYACAAKIASSVSCIPWKLYKKNSKGEPEEIKVHPLLDLFNYRVSEFYTSSDFFEMWAMYLALNGKFYALMDMPVRPSELIPLHPFRVNPVISENNEHMVKYFKYQDKHEYSSNLILWSKFFDPLSFYDGQSPIRAAARTIDTENSAIAWNKDSFDNMGMPPGALMLQNVSKQVIEKLKSKWKKEFAGPQNARMPLIFDSEKMQYLNFGLSQIDMDFLQQRKLTRTEICAAFGVPGQVVGDPEGQTYSNYEAALKSFWADTVIPRYLKKIQQELNKTIVQKWDPLFYVEYDTSNIEVLQEDDQIKVDKYTTLFNSNIITLNEAREPLGFEADKKNGDKYSYELASNISDINDYEDDEDDNS